MTNETTNNSDENICINSTFLATRTTLSNAFASFAKTAETSVNPKTILDSKACWAVDHDKKSNHRTECCLNIERKKELDTDYTFMTGPDSSAQQILQLMEESTPTDENEIEIKDKTITYINTWLELMHAFYTNFLAGVTIDEESFEDKYARGRSELIRQTNKTIINDYVDYMKEYEEWGAEDVERFLAEDDPLAVIPESLSQSYYAELDLLD